tara:strand:- start:40 stop:600 length:561 start_codon:yes stop_codon:yes gene_type:complete
MTSISNGDVDHLITELQCGGERRKLAVTQLYTEFADKIIKFLKLRGIADAEAEDILHDIFIAFIERANSFTPIGQGRGWIWTVVRSKLADRYRSAEKTTSIIDGDDWLFDEESYDEDRLKACIEGQMSVFSRDNPEAAQALSWVMDDELDLRSVASLLGRSYGATREFMSQIKHKLRLYIDSCLSN